jgi:hypothetical protein
MLRLLGALGLLGLVSVALARGPREQLGEWARDVSDALLSFLLRATSEFGRELTAEGWAEQQRWREQRLRELRTGATSRMK